MISVVVPLYKGEKYVNDVIHSISRAYARLIDKISAETIELIFVNDYPQEAIQLPEHGEAFPICLILHEQNGGIHQARVTGLAAAKGDFVLFLDQDDYIHEDFFWQQLECIGNADVVVCNGCRDFGEEKTPFYRTKAAQNLAKSFPAYIYGTDMIFSPGQTLIRRQSVPLAWKQHIMAANGCDDYFLWLLMLAGGARFTVCHATLYFHRETQANWSSSSAAMDSSFGELLTMLETHGLLSSSHRKALGVRFEIKKNRGKLAKQLPLLLLHPRILLTTTCYKLLGYY